MHEITHEQNFSTCVGIPSGPIAFEMFKEFNALYTSASVIEMLSIFKRYRK